MTSADGKTRLRKVDTIDEQFAVATYEAVRGDVVLGTITKFDEPDHKMVPTWKSGRRELTVRNFRIVSWTHSRDPLNAYDKRADCIGGLEWAAGVAASA